MENHSPLENQAFRRIAKVIRLLETAEERARDARREIAEAIVDGGRFAHGSIERNTNFETTFRIVRQALLGDDRILSGWTS